MKLALFDMDGTLIRTHRISKESWAKTCREVFGLSRVDLSWGNYKYVTDEGMMREAVFNEFGREISEAEMRKARNVFGEILSDAIKETGKAFVSVAGAKALLDELQAGREWRVAIATGAWNISAKLKLANAELDILHLPGAFAEDSLQREGILRTAIERAKTRHGVREFESIVSVGDAVWDLDAARNLRIGFVGVGGNGRDQKLWSAGAKMILPDFQNQNQVMDALISANTFNQ